MTKLEKAIEALSALPEDEQELIAQELLFQLSGTSAMTSKQRAIVEARLRQGLDEASTQAGLQQTHDGQGHDETEALARMPARIEGGRTK